MYTADVLRNVVALRSEIANLRDLNDRYASQQDPAPMNHCLPHDAHLGRSSGGAEIGSGRAVPQFTEALQTALPWSTWIHLIFLPLNCDSLCLPIFLYGTFRLLNRLSIRSPHRV